MKWTPKSLGAALRVKLVDTLHDETVSLRRIYAIEHGILAIESSPVPSFVSIENVVKIKGVSVATMALVDELYFGGSTEWRPRERKAVISVREMLLTTLSDLSQHHVGKKYHSTHDIVFNATDTWDVSAREVHEALREALEEGILTHFSNPSRWAVARR